MGRLLINEYLMHKFEVHFFKSDFCLHDNAPHPREVFGGKKLCNINILILQVEVF